MTERMLKQHAVGALIDFVVHEDGEILDLTGATDLKVRLKKPSGQVIEKTAALATDGSDGIIRYTSAEGDLDLAGKWTGEAVYTLGIYTGATAAKTFRVEATLA